MGKIEKYTICVAANGCPIIINSSYPNMEMSFDLSELSRVVPETEALNSSNPENPRVNDPRLDAPNGRDLPMGSVSVRINRSPRHESLENIKTRRIERLVENIGAIFLITPRFKEFSTIEARLLTFDKLEINMRQDKISLCEAGFLYTGDGQTDKMLCFFCGYVLRNWEDDDEPWSEHARWSPNCKFVLLSKGKRFVDEKRGALHIPSSEEELFRLIAGPRVLSILENNNILTNILESEIDHVEPTENNEVQALFSENGLHLPQQQDLNEIPDHKLCNICNIREIKVALIPCGHVIACVECAMKLNECAVCREQINMIIRVHVMYINGHLDHLRSSSLQNFNEPKSQTLCNVCQTKQMGVAFIPCRHIYACVDCAIEIDHCPICSKQICDTVYVYL